MDNIFLFELGTEEIPAAMIDPAVRQMAQAFEALLNEHSVSWAGLSTFSTPRRLAVRIDGLPENGPDREELILGPPVSVALDPSGEPTPAGRGFARKLGVQVESLESVDTERGAYLGLRRRLPGESVGSILQASLAGIIGGISWPKNMYWTESRFRFIRPLRWFVCLWNNEVLDFEFEGVISGRTSRGHRLIGTPEIEIAGASSYLEQLREARVLADPTERRQRIVEGLRTASGGFRLREDEELLDTVVNLVEFPSVLRGDFAPEFLEIPQEVLVTVMRYHQKYFSLEDQEGRLVPHFLTVLNTDADRDGRIRVGHEKVLQARLEDAAFFWKTDQKEKLESRCETLSHVLFQESLGSYAEKARRIEAICAVLSPDPALKLAARLCKADLTTDMVREFTELQGIMGGLYAREEGHEDKVWKSIYEHYQPISIEDRPPSTREGALLSLADRLDTVVGCLGAGIVPSGSSDPFGLRRQAQGLVMILLEKDFDFRLDWLVDLALGNFPDFPAGEVRGQALAFLQQRLGSVLQRRAIPQDVVRAVFEVGVSTAADAAARARAVAEFRGDDDFAALAVAFKRSRNILEKSGNGTRTIDPALFRDDGEQRLFRAACELKPVISAAVEKRDYPGALRSLAGIRGAVDRFFDEVLVMDEDLSLRQNRLALLELVCGLFLSIADPSEILRQEGERNGG